jgi:hypothetical protein
VIRAKFLGFCEVEPARGGALDKRLSELARTVTWLLRNIHVAERHERVRYANAERRLKRQVEVEHVIAADHYQDVGICRANLPANFLDAIDDTPSPILDAGG